jgi:spermidine synthase
MSAENNSVLRAKIPIVLLCFFLSGAAGLIYQVAWTKALGLVFGHTVYAVATVLAAFMGGLAAGSTILGRWGGKRARPIAVYGWMEILIAVTGVLSLFGLNAVRALYLFSYHSVAHSAVLLVATRLVGSFIVLFLPTFLMGGTLPILTRGVTSGSGELGTRLSRLYWINTAGAVAGAVAAGFLLMPEIGLRRTIVAAALLNLLAGILAFGAEKVRLEGVAPVEKQPAFVPRASVPSFLLIGFALVGATAMAYEIAWARLLASTLGSSTYAFTLMLATFLAGIALGSLLFERWTARGGQVSVGTFGVTQVLTGIAGVFFLVLFQQWPTILWELVTITHKTFAGLVFAQFATCAVAMLPAAIVFGFNFPAVTLLIAKSAGSDDSCSETIGRAYAMNTVGAIVGAIAVGFWLVPRFGSFRVAALTAAVNLLLAAYLASRRAPRRSLELLGTTALALVVAGVGWSGLFYDPAVATFGMITNRSQYPKSLRLGEVVRLTDLVFAEDGLNASVGVIRGENLSALRINGKTDASSGDQITQSLLGHLGMVLHQAPKRVLIVGFGSGMTASAVASYPEVEQIDCVEIEPAVIHAAPYLETLNHGVLKDPRLHIIVDDARNFLFTSQQQYDLIISEPSNPWIAGVATLFTDEFYQQVRAHLAPGGMLVQWVQSYALFPADLRMVMGTLAHQFPQVSAWQGLPGDVILLAQVRAEPLALDRLHRLWSVPTLRDEYESMGMRSPEGLIAFHTVDDGDLRRLAAAAPTNTDDLTRLEYRAPLAIFAEAAGPENMRMLAQQQSQILPASIPVADRESALVDVTATLASLGERGKEGVYLAALAQYPASAPVELLRGDWLAATNHLEEAQKAFANSLLMDPSSMDALEGLAEVERLRGEYDAAEVLLGKALARDPKSLPALTTYAMMQKSRGNWKEALDLQMRRVAADPQHSLDAMASLAELLLRTGDVRGAFSVCVDILNRDPYNLNAHRFLAEIFRRNGQWDQARVQLEVVARYFPMTDPEVYPELADVYRNLGRSGDAQDILRKSQRLFGGSAPSVEAASERR